MASKLQNISALSNEIGKSLADYENWTAFLKSAAWQYKYPFQDQILIYAQRPDATACASIDVWNKKLKAWINRGSKGIALLRADIGRLALSRIDINIEFAVALIYGAVPAVAALVFQPKHWRGAELLVAHVALRFHRGTGSGQLLGRPRFTHRYCLPSSSSTVK